MTRDMTCNILALFRERVKGRGGSNQAVSPTIVRPLLVARGMLCSVLQPPVNVHVGSLLHVH